MKYKSQVKCNNVLDLLSSVWWPSIYCGPAPSASGEEGASEFSHKDDLTHAACFPMHMHEECLEGLVNRENRHIGCFVVCLFSDPQTLCPS